MAKSVSKKGVPRARPESVWKLNRVCLLLSVLCLSHFYGVEVAYGQGAEMSPKHAMAIRVPTDVIRIDGRLNEQIWETAVAITDFVQKEPDEGAMPTDRMEVRFIYDDSALYVGARMFSSGTIQAPLSRRDDGDQLEHIEVE